MDDWFATLLMFVFCIFCFCCAFGPFIVSYFVNRINNRLKSQDEELRKCRSTIVDYKSHLSKLEMDIQSYENKTNSDFLERNRILNERTDAARSNLLALPYMSAIIADFETRGLDILIDKLDWGHNQERAKKVKSLREIKKETAELLAHYKESEYQLEYAIQMFPALESFLNTDYRDIKDVHIDLDTESSSDRVRDYLSPEEYAQLSSVQRNQLALDRYRDSHRKSNWQIGRDYELYVGHKYSLKGYAIDYYGSYNGLEDLGRDLIASKGNLRLIIQCKYWSSKKQIHEKHINQLYGTMVCYRFENNLPEECVRGILVTNITVSPTARKFAHYLGIEVVENFALGDYPCIKCNINYNECGELTKIYHLPFDQQYDSCKIDAPGEFYATTVAEAEQAGFRRAFRWHNSDN